MVSTNTAAGFPSPYYPTTPATGPNTVAGQPPQTGGPPAVPSETSQPAAVGLPNQASSNTAVARPTSDFDPAAAGNQVFSAGRRTSAPNGNEMGESLLKIVKALEALQPPTGPGPFGDVLQKLSDVTKRLGQFAQPKASQPKDDAQPASDDKDPGQPVAGTANDGSQPTAVQGGGNEIESGADADAPEAPEGSDEAQEKAEAEGGEEAGGVGGAEGSGDQTDPPPKTETEETGHHDDEGHATADPKPIKASDAESASETLARLKEKNIQRLLENLLGREQYRQLCDALGQQH